MDRVFRDDLEEIIEMYVSDTANHFEVQARKAFADKLELLGVDKKVSKIAACAVILKVTESFMDQIEDDKDMSLIMELVHSRATYMYNISKEIAMSENDNTHYQCLMEICRKEDMFFS